MKWEVLQPVQHGRPLHFVLLQALVTLALCKRWFRWAGTLVLGFEGIARISEMLNATRADLVLPADQFSNLFCSTFLQVLNPNTKRRGKGRASDCILGARLCSLESLELVAVSFSVGSCFPNQMGDAPGRAPDAQRFEAYTCFY